MPSPDPSDGPRSFLGITVRRSFVMGRAYLAYGAVMSSLLGVGLGATGGAAFGAAFPLLLPIFATVGSMGALQVFSNDRLKGVLEYLMAYGVSPRRQFLNALLASLVLASVLLAIALGVGNGFYLLRGGALEPTTVDLYLVYTGPMSYAAVAFATTVGMYWTSVSSPRLGISSPTGLAPFIGILPSVATLLAVSAVGVTQGAVSTSTFLVITGLAVGLVAAVVALLLGLLPRLLRRERLLSPA